VRKHRRRGRRHCAGGTIDAPGGTIDDRRDRRTRSTIDRSTRSRDRRTIDRAIADPPIARSRDPAIARCADPAIRVPRRDETDGRATAGRPHRDDGATDEDAVRVDAKG
jgi:hypothetical protein